jgi:hypothetical protein
MYTELLAKLIGLKDAELGQQLSVFVNGAVRVSTIYTMYAAHRMAGGVAAGNLVLVGLDMMQQLSGPSVEEKILDELKSLQRFVAAQTEAIVTKLNILDQRLIDMQTLLINTYVEVQETRTSLAQAHAKMDEIEREMLQSDSYLLNAVRAGFDRPLASANPERIGVEVTAHMSGEGQGYDHRRRREVGGTDLGVNPALEIAVAA